MILRKWVTGVSFLERPLPFSSRCVGSATTQLRAASGLILVACSDKWGLAINGCHE
jgi:hypothetical protein